MPGGLSERTLLDHVAVLVDVAVLVAVEGGGFDFGDNFDVCGYGDAERADFEAVEAEERGVVVDEVECVAEVGGHGAGEGEEDFGCDGRDDVLVSVVVGDVGETNLQGAGEEVPAFGHLGGRRRVQWSIWMCRRSEAAVHEAPATINTHSVPVVIRPLVCV